jgi:hypothetical protein
MRVMRLTRALAAASLVLAGAAAAQAQQRPLVTEDPETVGAGRVLIEVGGEYGRDTTVPESGLTGNLLRLPTMGVSVGLSSIAELQIDGGFYNRLSITDRNLSAPLANQLTVTGDSTSSVQDIIVATKLRLIPETESRPSFGLRLATKLPNAPNEKGIGLDTTDFFVSILGAKTAKSTRYVGNVGLAILADPTVGDRQSDLVTYGFSIAHAIRQGFEVVGEINGRGRLTSKPEHPGGYSRSQFRAGARYTVGPGRVDAAVIVGATSRDPGIGFTIGYTHVFNAFKVP